VPICGSIEIFEVLGQGIRISAPEPCALFWFL
jgi:hypothetical protein